MAADGAPELLSQAGAVADAILYEGYLLYPYRKSAAKNRVRWQFGVLAPRPWIEAHGGDTPSVAGSAESWYQQSECLLEAHPATRLHVRVRFLRIQAKTVEKFQPGGTFTPVDELQVGGQQHLSFEEAVPAERDICVRLGELLDDVREVDLCHPSHIQTETLTDQGRLVGRVVRICQEVRGVALLTAERADSPFRLFRLRLRIENREERLSPDASRPDALAASLIAAHALIQTHGGTFVSLLDPPEWTSRAVRDCRNIHAFPVLAGPEPRRDLMLCSPIILYDHPRVAPESRGDLYDATEIDEILSLRVLTLTDHEKDEARATDQRAATILDRVDRLSASDFRGLHGVMRPVPWWEPGADQGVSPDTDTVIVGGRQVARGTRVRLWPRQRGTDAHDMFLAGRAARVEAVLQDVDGSRHLAVTLEDDPGAEMHQWYGRFRYFSPGEVEPIGEEEPG